MQLPGQKFCGISGNQAFSFESHRKSYQSHSPVSSRLNRGLHTDDAASNHATFGIDWTVLLVLSVGRHVEFDTRASKFVMRTSNDLPV